MPTAAFRTEALFLYGQEQTAGNRPNHKPTVMQQIIYHLTDNDAYTFSCQYYVLQKYPRAEVEYTFFDRNNTVYPKGFGELVKEQLGMMPRVMITD